MTSFRFGGIGLMKYIQSDAYRFSPREGTPEVNTCWLMTRPASVSLDPATVENVHLPRFPAEGMVIDTSRRPKATKLAGT